MSVKRIVPNIAADDLDKAQAFYVDLLGLRLVMDQGWIKTFAAEHPSLPQVTVATQGGSGTQVPDLSVEVDDLDDVLGRALASGQTIEYGPTTEPWGVRRFFLRDPFGRLVNVLSHM